MKALNLFKKVKAEGAFPDSFYKASVIVLFKPGKKTHIQNKTSKRTVGQLLILKDHRCKIPH